MTGEDESRPGSPSARPLARPLAEPFPGVVLETRRLVIRPPALADAAALAALADNPKIAQNLTRMPHPYSLRNAEAYIAEPCPEDGLKHLLWVKRGGVAAEFVGAITLDHRRGPVPELGYWLGEAYWNRGYATEAAHAAVDYAFEVHGHERVNVSCRVTNGASRRVIEKCGFQYTGQDLSPSAFFRSVVAIDCFSLDRRTWESLRRWQPVSILGATPRAELQGASAGAAVMERSL